VTLAALLILAAVLSLLMVGLYRDRETWKRRAETA
jgi:hypothetical protein